MISTVKKVLFGFLIGLVLFLTVINWTSTEIRYLPFVDPVKLPLFLVMLLCFGAGALSSIAFQWLRKGKKKSSTP
jgi:uncharacterized integral membrane protein